MAEKLTPQQKSAVTHRGGNLLVSAAAGSGKTKVLVDRLLGFLTDEVSPANIDDFLIITYTNAAAAELRAKIAAKLTERIAEHPENRHLQQQLQRLYLAKISTVHGFCGDILREYAYELDIPGDFRIGDENECGELQSLVLEQVLEEAYEGLSDAEDLRAFFDSQGISRDDRQIPLILLQVYHSARCHLDPEEWLRWCETSGETTGISDPTETPWGSYLMEDLHACVDLHIDALTACMKRASQNPDMQNPAALLEDTVRQLTALRQSSTWDSIRANADIDYGRLTFSKKCTDLQLITEIKAVRNACKSALEKKLKAFADSGVQVLSDLSSNMAVARGLAALVRRFSVAYENRKKQRRLLDFGDLEHKTLDLLLGKKRGGPTAIAKEIGRRFREVMVDEYQDSNGVQDAIFSALTGERQNCFMVGDVKQSIYQFRLADPGIFLEKYRGYVSNEDVPDAKGRKVLLSSNFRSSGGVISAVNDVFSTCMSPELGGLAYGQEEQLNEGISHIPLNEPEVELHAIAVQEDTYAEEADFTAKRISALLDGTHMVRDKDTLRPVCPEDIVILLRSPGSVGGEFRYALERRGIRCVTGGTLNLLQTEEVESIWSLLQVIHNPLLDIPLVATLTSRIFCFTANELAEIRGKYKYASIFKALKADSSEKTRFFLETLQMLRSKARMHTITELLHAVLTATRADSIFAAMPNGADRTANIQSFLQLEAAFEATGRKELGQFLEHLEVLSKKGYSSPADERPANAVTIMSIHKSKGLEFPVVFLCGLSRGFNQESARAQVLCDKTLGFGFSCLDRKNRVRYPSIAKRAIAAKIMADSVSEELRVLYVAMTRARDRLIMTYADRNLENDILDLAARMDASKPLLLAKEADCPGTWILQAALQRTEAGALFQLAGHRPMSSVKTPAWQISVEEGVSMEAAPCLDLCQREDLPRVKVEQFKSALSFSYPFESATKAPSKLTATQLKGRLKDSEAAEHTAERKPPVFLRKPSFVEARASGKDYGNAMHAVMQYLDFSRCMDTDSIRQEVERLVSQQYISQEYGELVDCQAVCDFFATEIGRKLLHSSNVIREFKFSVLLDGAAYDPSLVGEEILLQGVVDCAVIEDDGITVIDFKTDKVTEETLDQAAAGYIPQVIAYKNAVSRIYQKPVKAAFLYFFHARSFVSV